jgi:hypothetical protein
MRGRRENVGKLDPSLTICFGLSIKHQRNLSNTNLFLFCYLAIASAALRRGDINFAKLQKGVRFLGNECRNF